MSLILQALGVFAISFILGALIGWGIMSTMMRLFGVKEFL